MSSICTICQDDYEKPKFLRCGHTFCASCLDAYIDSSFRKDAITCPLCRTQTSCQQNGAKSLMENFFAKIKCCSACGLCSCIKFCTKCHRNVCEKCFTSHKCRNQSFNDTTILENKSYSDEETESDENSDEVDFSLGSDGILTSETARTKYCFDLKEKIPVFHEYSGRMHGLYLNAATFVAYSDKCMVSPNRSNLLITFNGKGEELDRKYLLVGIVDLTIGARGFPLLIGSNTNLVFECLNGNLTRCIETYGVIPFALSSMKSGRVVVLGSKTTASLGIGRGTIRIYEYHGKLVREIPGRGRGYELNNLRSVDVNRHNDDIYVCDWDTGIVHLFNESGNFVSSYTPTENLANQIVAMPICYSHSSNVVFVSLVRTTSRSIFVLSPDLCLLGFVSLDDYVGVPAGLSMDGKDRLYIGDAMDGIVRVYAVSEFRNNIQQFVD